MESGVTTVTIFGQEYVIRGGGDPEYVREVAAHVDRCMQEVAQASSQVSSVKVAILAAINIADELFRERSKTEDSLEEYHAAARRLARSLEESCPPEAEATAVPSEAAPEIGGETLPGS